VQDDDDDDRLEEMMSSPGNFNIVRAPALVGGTLKPHLAPAGCPTFFVTACPVPRRASVCA
jgi:hypothetical protein